MIDLSIITNNFLLDCESTWCFYYLNTNASSWISGGIGKVSQWESSAPCWKSSSKSLDDMKSNCSAGCAKNSNFTYI